MSELKEKAIKAAEKFLERRGYEVIESNWKSEGGALRQVRHWNRGCVHAMGCLPNPSRTAFPTADECGADPRVSMVSIKTQYTLICDTIDTHRHPLEMVHLHAPDHLLAERDPFGAHVRRMLVEVFA